MCVMGLRHSTGSDSAAAQYTFHDAISQGLTLVHFSAQVEHSLWDRGCA